MAKQRLKQFGNRQYGERPYGNLSRLPFGFATNATGVVVDGTQGTALAVNDKVILGTLPAGFAHIDVIGHVADAFDANVTVKLGIEYVDGEDSTKLPQADDFLSGALALSAAGVVRKTGGGAPVPLPKDAYVVATITGAAVAKAGKVAFSIVGEMLGAP